jgi:flagellar biosynthesis/type III secretory pathway M-ring protein FliF/YscJ
VNRADRGPLLLIVAGVLLLLAVVAYLVNDAEDNSRRREAAVHDRQAARVHVQRATAELKALEQERDRNNRDRAELQDQNRAILESLKRIEKLLREKPRTGADR